MTFPAVAAASNPIVGAAAEPSPLDLSERLVWAEWTTSDSDVKILWPALIFTDVQEFDGVVAEEAKATNDFSFRYKLAMLTFERDVLAPSGDTDNAEDRTPRVVRFLGRPLGDALVVCAREYYDFVQNLHNALNEVAFQPDRFPQGFQPYMDFHRGLEQAMAMVAQKAGPAARKSAAMESLMITKAEQKWIEKHGSLPAVTQAPAAIPAATTQETGGPLETRRHPPARAMAAAAASPNHSVAAVSLAESLDSRMMSNTPASTVATALDHQDDSAAKQAASKDHDFSQFPKLGQPLGNCAWKGAWVHLRCAGWSRHLENEEYRYTFAGGPEHTSAEIQEICQKHYGWKPQPNDPDLKVEDAAAAKAPPAAAAAAAATPPPTRSRQKLQAPQSVGREYSFEFLWKHKCAPNGWTYKKPRRNKASLVNYYYLRPGFTVDKLGVEGRDHFLSHYDVLDWCHRNRYYPSPGGSSSSSEGTGGGDESSVSTMESMADDPSVYVKKYEPQLEEEESEEEQKPAAKGKRARPPAKNKSKAKTEPSRRNYSFGVLWAIHLEPNEWTMVRAKGHELYDYFYVRPGFSVETGTFGIHYFGDTDAVLKWCEENNYYPDPSSCESTIATMDRDDGTSTVAHGDTTDEESTKHPAESEEDEGTVGEYSTPGTRTKPQDPGKPILPDPTDQSPELSYEQKYLWKNLWPVLRDTRGWTVVAGKNKLDDWWWMPPPRYRENDDDGEEREGRDYFRSEQAVIDYCKEMDRHADPNTSKLEDHRREESSVEPMEVEVLVATRHAKNSKTTKRKRATKSAGEHNKSKQGMDVVFVDPAENTAPWVTDPLPRDGLHALVLAASNVTYRSNNSYLLPAKYTKDGKEKRFQDIFELRKHICSLGRDNYAVNPEAGDDFVKTYVRFMDYGLVPSGRNNDHFRVPELNRDQVIYCLEKVLNFKQVDGKWVPPEFLQAKDDTKNDANVKQGSLKPSYGSLSELCRALRAVENLECKEPYKGRNRQKDESKDRWMLAFRLSIAEDKVVDKLDTAAPPSKKARVVSKATKTKRKALELAHDEDELSFTKGCEKEKTNFTALTPVEDTAEPRADGEMSIHRESEEQPSGEKRRKRPSQASTSKKKPKKQKEGNDFVDLLVKADPSKPAPWAKTAVRRDFWPLVKKLGVSYYNGNYYIPGERASIAKESIDAIFQHWGTYGGYDLSPLDQNEKAEVMYRIRAANVPIQPSRWKDYRILKDSEGIQILKAFGFEEQPEGNWTVPPKFLEWKNYDETAPLLQNQYPSLDDLRVALRSIPDFDRTPGESRRSRVSAGLLNSHQMVAFRLWLAFGPEGSTGTTNTSKGTEDQPVPESVVGETCSPDTVSDGVTVPADEPDSSAEEAISQDNPVSVIGDTRSPDALTDGVKVPEGPTDTTESKNPTEDQPVDEPENSAEEATFKEDPAPVIDNARSPSALTFGSPCSVDESKVPRFMIQIEGSPAAPGGATQPDDEDHSMASINNDDDVRGFLTQAFQDE